ncbi:UNVERIFIED_CONTAM: hypothetical protein K2H54_016372 [Gekko kuhli]
MEPGMTPAGSSRLPQAGRFFFSPIRLLLFATSAVPSCHPFISISPPTDLHTHTNTHGNWGGYPQIPSAVSYGLGGGGSNMTKEMWCKLLWGEHFTIWRLPMGHQSSFPKEPLF